MRIIVDANIVFSAILNTNSKIGDILLNSSEYFEFISPDYLFKELEKYHQKIARITNLSVVEIQTLIENNQANKIYFCISDT